MATSAKGNRVAMTSNGAGPMIGGIDHLERLGLTIGKLTPKLVKKLRIISHQQFLSIVVIPQMSVAVQLPVIIIL